MSEDIRRKVISVGNSWVVCKSKSHPGHVFYFNSFTGETAWNLSDAEIEKAKTRTKHLERLPGAKPVKGPEPKEKPPLKKDSEPLQSPSKVKPPSSPSKKYSEPVWSLSTEQLENNKNSEQQSSDITNSNIANSNSSSCTPSMRSTQVYNPAPIEPVFNFNSYDNRLNTYHLNNTSIIYNPKIWAVPQTQQFFISPGLATVENHNPGPLNVAYSQTVPQPVTGHVFNRFYNPTLPATPGTQSFYPRNFKYDKGANSLKKNKFRFTKKNDLRQKLSFRKRNFHKESSIPGGSGFFNTNPRNADIAANIAKNVEGINSNDLDAGMERRCVETQLHVTPSRIDVGPLKSLAPSNSNTDAWFIVVDLEVLLNNFKFLTTLTDSDDKCYLMVPKRVMEELKSYVTSTKNIQAKRILRFLSQQIEIGYAYMAVEPSKLEDDSMAEAILTTCKDLLAINYHSILLTNDDELLTKSSTNIKMFSVDEINKLLMVIPNKQLVTSGPKKPYISNDLINKIKITVPNDAPKNIDITPVGDNHSDDHIDNIPFTKPKQETTQDKTEQLTILKKTVDTGIQTDLEDINASSCITNMTEQQHLNADSNHTPLNRKEPITVPPVSVVSNIPEKKRGIKLKRSVSHQPTVNSAESEKKQFKWRRKTNTSLQVNQEVPSHSEQKRKNKNVESVQTNTLNNEIFNISNKTLYNVTLDCPENKILDDSMESRDSSIHAEPRNSTTKENVTIEETSTSGIISNTESNVDADSNASNTTNSINQQSICNEQSNKAMYEVDSITMEQYLKTKCDEWISRFIQIMEEVLTQVLLQDPPFTNNAMPPPWTLHEAAQCVIIKFCGHQNIISAANNLSNILWQVSDAKGHITENMTPSQYMQMYSYGIHLLAAITVINRCEDIKIAVGLLNKLLYDIQNPNMDSNDDFNENKLNNVSADSDTPNVSDEGSFQELVKEISDCSPVKEVPKDKKSIPPEELQKPVKFIRTFELPISSIENLGRQRFSPRQSREDQHLTHSQLRKGNTPRNTNETTEKRTDSDVPTHEPTFMRKFTKFPRSVEKLSRDEQNLTHSQIKEGNNAQNANETTEKGTDCDVPTYEPNVMRKSTQFPSLVEKRSREEQHLTHSQIREGNNARNTNETTEKGTDSDVPSYKTNIIRKFTTFPMFEDKLSPEEKLSRKDKLSLEEKLSPKDKLLLEEKLSRKDKLSPEEKLSGEENLSREDKLSRKEKLSQEKEQSPEEQNLTYLEIREDNPQNANETAEKGIDSVAPTIIRKFRTFPEFEEKLKSNYNLRVYEDHDFELDYNESYDEYITDDYCLDDENYNEQRLDVIDNQNEVGAITNDAYEPEEADTNEAYETINLEDDSPLSDENTKKFKYMVCMLLREIKNALNQVRVLCDQCYKELENPEVSTELKYQLRKKAERAHLDTLRLCRSLESMLDNEMNNPTQSMSEYLEEANINIRHVDANLLLKYRTTVAKCKEHANEFLSSIRNIISDIKR